MGTTAAFRRRDKHRQQERESEEAEDPEEGKKMDDKKENKGEAANIVYRWDSKAQKYKKVVDGTFKEANKDEPDLIANQYKYKRNHDGRLQIQNHTKPCALCSRYNELCRAFKIKSPSVLDYHADMATYIHREEFHYNPPLWLSFTQPQMFMSETPVSCYTKLNSSLQRDFFLHVDNLDFTWTKWTGNKTKTSRVISFSLYIDNFNDFFEYWVGLKLNISAIRKWFVGWTIHLFVEDSFREKYPNLVKKIVAYAEYSEISLNIMPCRKGAHPMLERYRPLVTSNTGVCIVRDVDSILSLTDAKIIHAWLQDDDCDVLIYREYIMNLPCCGGGVAVKLDKKLNCDAVNNLDTVIGPTRGRDYDEEPLGDWLHKATDSKRRAVVQVRMTRKGHYCLDFYRDSPKALWACTAHHPSVVSMYQNTISMKELEKKCEKLMEKSTVPDDIIYVHSHTKANRGKILKKDTWQR